MKKLMIAACAVAFAAAAQAASINWTSTAGVMGVGLTGLDGNGSYAAGGKAMKGNGTLTYTMAILSADGSTTLDSGITGTVAYNAFGTGFSMYGISTKADLAAGTTYQYEIVLNGTQADLRALGESGDWDYSDATVSATIKGTFEGKTGASAIASGVPTSWTVSGAVAVPEPTSGLILLLGVAGLALRRRRA